MIFKARNRSFDLKKTIIFGILNVTPDSFYDGGRWCEPDIAIKRAFKMIEEGADIIDLGGESTKPFVDPTPLDVEIERILPVLKELVKNDISVSVDTYKPEVAKIALEEGAIIINDIFGLRSEGMLETISSFNPKPGIIIMHMKKNPKEMQINPEYDNIFNEISEFLHAQAKKAISAGFTKENILLDVGLGFGKSFKDNLKLCSNYERFLKDNFLHLIGPSRKSFTGLVSKGVPTEDRLPATISVSSICVYKGIHALRVHDVKEIRLACDMAEEMRKLNI
ncbi:dihydropteroate synthase [Thermodesulfobium narugense DSM 14796]|uniref:Dihydropteroate synthase n=1 Tax=Thermodesulfobium narugense DSM 14796 TaxID=747365 RepID=M1E7R7_9BACT|nr:dihydropteroate synthase [Thermodesulfobium narugense]AEE15376.1 dihydropteroate synthase [Thermodesulfobium narugense DSM 14796]